MGAGSGFAAKGHWQILGRDSVIVPADTLGLPADTISMGSANVPDDGSDFINATIFYDADTIVFDAKGERILLYGNGRVRYEKIELDAGFIIYDMKNSQVTAHAIADTSGTLVGHPIFKEGKDTFNAKLIKYNFKSGKAYIEHVVTEESEMYLHSEKTVRHPDEYIHIRNGKFTTCNADNPHYHFHLTKAIAIPDDKIVSGPVYMKVRKIPTPLALPFGFFPNKKTGSHGIIIPSYGDGDQLGFFLRDGGYYIPLGQYADTRIIGDIYTRGSWTIRNMTSYRKRYRYTGNFNISRTVLKRGFSELPNFRKDTEFFIRWNHNQDAKARPGVSFSANVNAGSRNNFQNNLNSSQNDYLSNTFQSGISWAKQWQSKPYNLRANLRHSQNSQTGNVDFTLPSVAFNVSRFDLPLSWLRKTQGTSKKWYEQIGANYMAELENRINVPDSEIRLNNMQALANRQRNGIRHTAGLRTTFKAGYVSFVPAMNFTEVWYLDQLRVNFDPETGAQVRDTIGGFNRHFDMNASVTANTKFFGTFNFRNAKRIKAVRHVVTPNVGLTWRPNTGADVSVPVPDSPNQFTYNPMDIGVFGRVGGPASGALTYGVMNNLEMKWMDTKGDKPVAKKIAIIESYRLGGSYDFFRDSLRFSDISASGFTSITDKLNLTYNAIFTPYDRDSLGRPVDRLLVDTQGKLWNMRSTSLGFNMNLRSGMGKKKEKPKTSASDEELAMIEQNRQEFVDFNVPWNLNLTYSLNLRKQFVPQLQADTLQVTQSILFNGDFTVFKKWKVGFNSGYDLVLKDFTPTTLNVYWDLHCWEAALDIIPFGIRKSYAIRLNVKAAVLQDLRLQRVRNLGQSDLLL
jgi:hypothetical protein